MARPTCEKHKRYVPYCDDCKAAQNPPEEQPEAANDAESDADANGAEEASEALKAEVGFPGATIDETEKAMTEAGEFDSEPDPTKLFSVPFPDPDATVTRPAPVEDAPEAPPEEPTETEETTPDPLPEGFWESDNIKEALAGAAYADGAKAGRKQVIAWVKEWFADSADTGAFQLLENLNKRARQ